MDDFLLTESGDSLLQENSGKIVLEEQTSTSIPSIPPILGKGTISPPFYQVELRDQFGRPFITIARPQQKQFSLYRNKPGSCQFVLDLYDPQALPQYLVNSVNTIVFRRNGIPVFAGQLTYHEPKIDDSDTGKTVDITATGFFDQLDYRMITNDYPGFDALHNKLPFASTDVGMIAWTLIQYAQFPVPNADDPTASTTLIDGFTTIQQSFIAQGSNTITLVKFILQNNNITPTTNFIVSLINDANGLPQGSLVPNSTLSIPASNISSDLGWFEIVYPTPIDLTQGQVYWLSLSLDQQQTGSNGLALQVLSTDFYPLGRAYSLQNPTLFAPDQDIQFFVLLNDNSYSMTKNTYLGIKQGVIQPSFELAPSFDRFKHVKAAVEDMSTTFNGIDFAISAQIDPNTNFMTKYFNVYYPSIGVSNLALPFTYPGNIKKMGKPKDGTTLVNETHMRGQGSGIAQLLTVVRDNSSIGTYGVRQKDQSEPDVADLGTLTSYGQEYIRISKDPSELPAIHLDGNLPPAYGAYGIGDLIQITVNDPRAPILNFTNQYKIEQIDTSIDDDGVEEIVLSCSPV